MSRLTNLLAAAAAAGAMLFGMAAANAAPVTGEFSMEGDFSPTGGSGIGTATGIDFLGDDFTVSGVGDAQITGSFVPFLDGGQAGTITDFTFSPFSGPIAGFWSVGGFSFTMSTLGVVFQSSTFLLLSGTGTIVGNGFDATPGTWDFSAQGGQTTFSFSATAAAGATPVPEPATLALVAAGLLGLGRIARRRSHA